jgi:hypothetical protein
MINSAGTESKYGLKLTIPTLIPALCGWFIGLLMGHLWWRMKGNKDTEELGLDEKHK